MALRGVNARRGATGDRGRGHTGVPGGRGATGGPVTEGTGDPAGSIGATGETGTRGTGSIDRDGKHGNHAAGEPMRSTGETRGDGGAASVTIHGAPKYPRGHPSGSIGTHTHPHVRLGTHGQLPYLAPRFTSSATTGQCQPATVRCIGLLCKAVNMDTACVGLNRHPASLELRYKH